MTAVSNRSLNIFKLFFKSAATGLTDFKESKTSFVGVLLLSKQKSASYFSSMDI